MSKSTDRLLQTLKPLSDVIGKYLLMIYKQYVYGLETLGLSKLYVRLKTIAAKQQFAKCGG